MSARGLQCRKLEGYVAGMRVSSSKGLELQKETGAAQREYEFRVPARGVKCRKDYGYAAGMRITSASKRLEIQKALGLRSGTCEFRVPTRGIECRTLLIHSGNANSKCQQEH